MFRVRRLYQRGVCWKALEKTEEFDVLSTLILEFELNQQQLFEQLQARESRLVDQLREELERMRAWVREEMSAPAEAERIHLAFEQLAASAREIADRFPSRS